MGEPLIAFNSASRTPGGSITVVAGAGLPGLTVAFGEDPFVLATWSEELQLEEASAATSDSTKTVKARRDGLKTRSPRTPSVFGNLRLIIIRGRTGLPSFLIGTTRELTASRPFLQRPGHRIIQAPVMLPACSKLHRLFDLHQPAKR